VFGRVDDEAITVTDRFAGVLRGLHDNCPKPPGRLFERVGEPAR